MKTASRLLVITTALVAADAHAQAIFGTVKTVAGVPIEGVLVRATQRLQRISTTTDVSGGYVLGAGLNGLYQVEAIEAGYTFTPASTNVTVSGVSVRVDFTAPATLPDVTTLEAIDVGPDFAELPFRLRPNGAPTAVRIQYGLTAGYGSISNPRDLGSSTNFLTTSIYLGGLMKSTTYHYRAMASNSFGVRFGADETFTTLSGVPGVVTLPPSFSATAATLNGSVNPGNAGVIGWFDLGTTTNYGNVPTPQFLGYGTNFTNFSQNFIGLTPGTTYHYRAVAASNFGTNYGSNVTFTPLFTLGSITNKPVAGFGALAWGDYDNDGRLDVAASPLSGVWRNTGGGFLRITNAGLPYAADGSIAWGDYDSDGWLDILLTGWTWPITTTGLARVYHNNRDGTFTDLRAGLPGIHRSSALWGDYNNDGRLDILLAGLNVSTNPITQVWRNTGFGFVHDTSVALPGISHGALAWGDYDNDGRLDILLAGSTTGRNTYEPPHASIGQVWRNTGTGFVNIDAGLPGVSGWNNHCAVAWGDCDNDGRLDIVLAGTTNGLRSGAICQVWRNTGSGFAFHAALTGVIDCAVGWGDCDNDGWLDLLLSGNGTNGMTTTEVWRNTGAGFVNLHAGLAGNTDGGAAWGDFDNDGRLDILVAGLFATGDGLWRNNIPETNTPPGAPTGLAFSFANSAMTFSWNPPTDDETPASGLSYNLRVGISPGGAEVVSAMAGPNGLRRLPQAGNAQQRLSATLALPSMNTPYHWSVQAIDGAFAGSPFAAGSPFKLLPVLVSLSATNPMPGDLDGDSLVALEEINAALANYYATSPWLEITNTAGLGGTNVTFALSNSLAGAFSVEYSSNLLDWFFLGPATPRYEFLDTNAPTQPQRSYRLRWP